jgi:hypothetical protein
MDDRGDKDTKRTDSQPRADFVEIFYIKEKKELVRHCKSITITMSIFTDFILASEYGLLPWIHKIHYRDYIPEHLVPTEEEHLALRDNGVGPLQGQAKKMFRKIHQTFEERRYLVGHIFYRPDLTDWHFFYFDQRDWAETKNHWKHGSHIHLVNHLWPNYDAEGLWERFTKGNVKLGDSLHIRFDGEKVTKESTQS